MMPILSTAGATEPSGAYQAGQAVGTLLGVAVAGVLVLGLIAVFIVSMVKFVRTKKRIWLVGIIAPAVLGLGVVGVVAAGFISGMTSSMARIHERTAAAQAGGGATNEVVSDDGWVRLSVPARWSALNLGNRDASFTGGNMTTEEYVTLVSELKTELAEAFEEEIDIDRYTEIISGGIQDSLDDAAMSDSEVAEIGGFPARRVGITGRMDELDLTYLLTVVESPDGFHQILGWTLTDLADTVIPLIRAVGESFAVAGSAPAPEVDHPEVEAAPDGGSVEGE
ncbi:hypothetical protein BH23VER1_BH23VER1_24640 [soil metagenome]